MLWVISVLEAFGARATSLHTASKRRILKESIVQTSLLTPVIIDAATQQSRPSSCLKNIVSMAGGPVSGGHGICTSEEDITNIFAPPASAHELLQDIVEDPLATPILESSKEPAPTTLRGF